MTKEEITKEAQKQVNYYTPLYPENFIQGYVAGAEPREKQIELLGERCNQLLRDKGNLTDQLTKAKELLQHFISMDLFQIAENDQDYNAIEQAEQFIKEIEK